MEITGYLHAGYPASLGSSAVRCRFKAQAAGCSIRVIQGTAQHDAVGPYPLFCCPRWPELGMDLARLDDRLVSIVLVTDPFGPERPRCHRGAPSVMDW